ncbi:hypothetical protein BG004_008009 [Podila humilis]|nr:hypothetical protein BG004_008009 [Podila humilis]
MWYTMILHSQKHDHLHIILRVGDASAIHPNSFPAKLSSLIKEATFDNPAIFEIHGKSFDEVFRQMEDKIILECWPSAIHPVVWVAPGTCQVTSQQALQLLGKIRQSFTEDALDIVLAYEGCKQGKSYKEPEWLQSAWKERGPFVLCLSNSSVQHVAREVAPVGTLAGAGVATSTSSSSYSSSSSSSSAPYESTRSKNKTKDARFWCAEDSKRTDVDLRINRRDPHYKTVETVSFYDNDKPFYEFTNFYQGAGFVWEPNMTTYSTVEHFFQAMKTTDGNECRWIGDAPTAREALTRARSSNSLKFWWDQQCRCGDIYKERVMYQGLVEKFSIREPKLRNLLMSTGTAQLKEDSPVDSYWGAGKDGKGKNRLGFLLERLRTRLVREEFVRRNRSFEDHFIEKW